MNEQEQFLKDIEVDNKLPETFEKPLTETETPAEKPKEEEGTEENENLKNRRERRLYERLERRGEEARKYAEENLKLKQIIDSQETRKSTEEADYLKLAEKIYGDDTPEAKEATNILKDVLRGVHKTAKEDALKEALERIEAERTSESKEIAEQENYLDEVMESLEDDYDADFSDETTRKGFLTLLEKVSPKDKEGNIIEYADARTTWELYESRKGNSSSRAKELASRSMERGGGSSPSKLQDEATQRILREMGVL